MKDLSFKLRIKSRPVAIEDEAGKVQTFELREMKASARDKYMDKLSQRLVLNAAGDIIGIKKFDGMHIDLLTACMFAGTGNEAALVEKAVLEKWPSSCVAQLFQAAQELNLFRKPDERNSIVAKAIMVILDREPSGFTVTLDEIEKIIDQADGKLFDEESTQTDG